MTTDKKPPHVPKALLEYLKDLFPDRLPTTLGHPREMYFLMGQQKVIQKLDALYREQTTT